MEELKIYHEALADILCWIDGYHAGGGSGLSRLNLEGLSKLKGDLQDAIYGSCPLWINK